MDHQDQEIEVEIEIEEIVEGVVMIGMIGIVGSSSRSPDRGSYDSKKL